MNKLLLIDGNNVMFRAYYATAATGNLMRNKNGFPTNMLYGFLNIYNKVINDGYTHVAVCFDKGSKTRRHLIYKDYKAGRAETPHELIDQIPYLHRILEGLNVKFFLDYDFEADDIIASLSREFSDEVDEVDVLSNDNDLFQLIDDKHFQIYTKQKETIKYSSKTLFDEKGITPSQIPDYKALIGDKSDNLKGVDGIGPVGASKLLSVYNTLDGIYENIDNLKDKEKEKLLLGKESAYFTLDLARLNPTFNSGITLDDLKVTEPNVELLQEIYVELDFNSFLKKLPIKREAIEFSYIETNFSLDLVSLNELNYMYVEIDNENYHQAGIVGVSLTVNDKSYAFLKDEIINNKDFITFIESDKYKKVVYDYKKDYVLFKYLGINLSGVYNDVLLSSYVVDNELGKLSLENLANHFGLLYLLDNENDEMGFFDEVNKKKLALMSKAISNIHEKEMPIIKENEQEYLLFDIEIPFSRVLADMEIKGLRVDEEALDLYEDKLSKELKELEDSIYNLVGHKFNILSPKQLGEVLFEELNLPSGKKTKTGYSTDSSVLEGLREFNPIIDLILRYRMISKLEGTYVLGVRSALKVKGDKHIHTIYKQALTDTGRLSSTEPNLQNLPIRNKEASEFRKIFIPEDDSVIISSDYSQIELRVMAHMSGDETLTEAFNKGEDIHEATAKAILKKDSVTKEERSKAKAINFGIIYGISAWGLASDTKISAKEASEFIDKYHETFKRIEPFTSYLINYAKENGYVKTIFNRRRYIRDINSSIYNLREFSKRTAMNAPIQGSAADILKKAMIELDKAIKDKGLHAFMILTIHDEIVLNALNSEKEETIKLVKDVMQNTIKLNVPLLTEASFGTTLYEAK